MSAPVGFSRRAQNPPTLVGGGLDCSVPSEGLFWETMLSVPTIRELHSEEELLRCVDLLRAAFGTVARDFELTKE